MEEALATGGYRAKDGIAIHYLAAGEPRHPDLAGEDLLDIKGARAVFGGGPGDLARGRYDADAEGEAFTLGARVLTRLTRPEFRDALAGRAFTWSLF